MPARELHDLEPAGDLALGVVDRLAVLIGHDAGELVHVLVDELAHREHDPGPAQDTDVTPVVKRLGCRLHGRVDVGGLCEQHVCLLLAGRRVPDDTVPGRSTRGLAAADPVLDRSHRRASFSRGRCAGCAWLS